MKFLTVPHTKQNKKKKERKKEEEQNVTELVNYHF